MRSKFLTTRKITPTLPPAVWRLAAAAADGLRRGGEALGNLLAPPVCAACRTRLDGHGTLCPACWREVAFIRPPLCDRLGLPLPYDPGSPAISAAAAADPPEYARARAVASYAGTMRSLIHDFKYRDHHGARRLFARWLRDAGRELLADPSAVLIPVPMTWSGLVRRRFNQAAILAQETGRLTGHPVLLRVLCRARSSRRQVGLRGRQRRENVRNAFVVPASRRALIVGRPVILIDDVITTGATARACTCALLDAGAARVEVLALALVTDTARILP